MQRMLVIASFQKNALVVSRLGFQDLNDGLFVPLHFPSQERKVHRENFCSCGTFVPLDRTFQELLLPGTFDS